MNDNYISFDIETVPSDEWCKEVNKIDFQPASKLNSLDNPPATILKVKSDELREEKLTEWKKEQQIKLDNSVLEQRQKMIETAALYWWSGKIVCITAKIRNKKPPMIWFGSNEAKILSKFFDWLAENPGIPLIGKSSDDFDVPFIIGRAMAHNLGIPYHLRMGKPDYLSDIDKIWGFSKAAPQRSSLNNYCIGLGIKQKIAHGTDVAKWYDMAMSGDDTQWKKITEYCVDDTMIVDTILDRYLKPYNKTQPANPVQVKITNVPF